MIKKTIGVIGGGNAAEAERATAYETGMHIATNGLTMVCGGLGGVMEAAAHGAAEHGGLTIGVLPGEEKTAANPYIHIVIPTGMGIARNLLVVRASDVLIAFPGSYGTLSEIALALNLGKAVIALPGVWNLPKAGEVNRSLFKEAVDPRHAVGLALDMLRA